MASWFFKEDKLRGKPGYEHLSDPLHILIEAEFPASIIDARLKHAQEIIEELLKPVVSDFWFVWILLLCVHIIYLYLLDYCMTPLAAAHWNMFVPQPGRDPFDLPHHSCLDEGKKAFDLPITPHFSHNFFSWTLPTFYWSDSFTCSILNLNLVYIFLHVYNRFSVIGKFYIFTCTYDLRGHIGICCRMSLKISTKGNSSGSWQC